MGEAVSRMRSGSLHLEDTRMYIPIQLSPESAAPKAPSGATESSFGGGSMRSTRLLLIVAIAGVLGTAMLAKRSYADAKNSLALTRTVTSAEEGAREGVLGSARKTGSSRTTAVLTDDNDV